MDGIEIKTERLTLRPIGPSLLATTDEYALDAENTKYMCFLPNRDSAETLAFLRRAEAEWARESPTNFEFAIFLGDRHIGSAGVTFEDGVGELGWIVNRKYWGCGYGYEAARALVDYIAEHFGTKRFRAHCDTENTASRRIMEKLGMVRTAVNGGRRNRSAAQDSLEYQYELRL